MLKYNRKAPRSVNNHPPVDSSNPLDRNSAVREGEVAGSLDDLLADLDVDLQSPKHGGKDPEKPSSAPAAAVGGGDRGTSGPSGMADRHPQNQPGVKKNANAAGDWSSGQRLKCSRIILGPSDMEIGLSTALQERCCGMLRCTKCDFRVLSFDDAYWSPKVDYLFFRNVMPDKEKLRKKLTKKGGTRAYACQCGWFSVMEGAEYLTFGANGLNWVCSGHSAG
jgi:hypothetical protein